VLKWFASQVDLLESQVRGRLARSGGREATPRHLRVHFSRQLFTWH